MFGSLGLILLGCRFREHPYWIEAHGHAIVHDVAASALGVCAVAMDDRLLRYPGEFGNSWTFESDGSIATIAGRDDLLISIQRSGALTWLRPSHREVPGSTEWKLSRVALSSRERVFVIADGRVRQVRDDMLSDVPCSSLSAEALAASQAEIWIVSQGKLHRDDGAGCQPVQGAPERLLSVAASETLLGVTTVDGGASVRGTAGWLQLPLPTKRRIDQLPRLTQLKRLAIGRTTTHGLDHEGAVFLLSEQPL